MLFNSIEFLIFYPIVTIIYYALPHGFRWAWLLAASCAFYMAFVPVYILILALTIVIDYLAGIYLEDAVGKRRRQILIGSIVSTCLILFVFKYFDFAATNLTALASAVGWNYSISALGFVLPIGLSFHTFQSLSYVIEVYERRQRPERHFGIYSLYVMFYPQLVAGPIERPQNLLHQFREPKRFDYDMFVSGLRLMLWGCFKKVVIADRLAVYVNEAYRGPENQPGSQLLIGTVFFAFQIFCDFSGYSDIARGAARTMGFELMRNFDRPYNAASVGEFWRRWHISLSTWFRDYVFVPLGGSRVSLPLRARNLMIVFVVSGVWHGANWTFLTWGLVHGLFVVAELMTVRARENVVRLIRLDRAPALRRMVQVGITFSLVSFAWIFFRAETMTDAWSVIRGIGNLSTYRFTDLNRSVWLSFALIGALQLVHWYQRENEVEAVLAGFALPKRWTVYAGLTLGLLYLGSYEARDFIYFQF